CEVIRSLWTERRSTFKGSYYHLADAPLDPKPVQRPHPELMIGGGGERVTLRIVAKHADHLNVWGCPRVLARTGSIIDEHGAAVATRGAPLDGGGRRRRGRAAWRRWGGAHDALASHPGERRDDPHGRPRDVAHLRHRRVSDRARAPQGGPAAFRRGGRARDRFVADVRGGRGRGGRPCGGSRDPRRTLCRYQGLDERARRRRRPDGAVAHAPPAEAPRPDADPQLARLANPPPDPPGLEGGRPHPLPRRHPLCVERLRRAGAGAAERADRLRP